MRTCNSIFIFLLASIVGLFSIACNAKTEAPAKVNVDTNIVVALYSTSEIGDSLDVISPCLLEETVHIAELLRYPGDEITMPFNFSDTSKYAEITGNNLEKRIAISVNGQVISMPVVKMKIENGACSVTLDETQIKSFFSDINIEELKSTAH